MHADADVEVERDVTVDMRDGTSLAADIYRPGGDGPWPVLLMRLPYGKTQAQTLPGMYDHPTWYARQGFIVVVQDTRGRYASEGEFVPFRHEAIDGYDTVEWAAELPGSNGQVGMYGFSYVGATQLQAAVEQPPSLTCISPAFTSGNFYDGWAYRGGAFLLAFNVSWARFLAIDTAQRADHAREMARLMDELLGADYSHLPLNEFPGLAEHAPYFYDWVEQSTDGPYWQEHSPHEDYDAIEVPGLHVAGWYDTFLEGTLRTYTQLRESSDQPQRLLIYPWWHVLWGSDIGEASFGEEARNDFDREQIHWLKRWLTESQETAAAGPPVKLFVMGANTWREAIQWPPTSAEPTRFYLHSDGPANSSDGEGMLDRTRPEDEPPDTYASDPRNPVPSLGGRSCCIPDVVPMGPANQRPKYARKDILLYTSEPLAEDLEVTGPVSATLWVASTAPDTDFVAKLVDLHPDGRAMPVAEGILRARFRNSLSNPEPLEPDEVYELTIDLAATSNVFAAGHRLQFYVASSDFPQYDRNPNTGQDLGTATHADFTTATQTIYHDRERPSHVTLPVIDPPISSA